MNEDIIREIASFLPLEDIKKFPKDITYDVYDEVRLDEIRDNFKCYNIKCLRNITNNGLKDIPRSVTTLNLSWCSLITSEGLKDIPRSVTTLDLSHCSLITSEGLKDIPRSVTTLYLSHCSSEGLKDIPENCKVYR